MQLRVGPGSPGCSPHRRCPASPAPRPAVPPSAWPPPGDARALQGRPVPGASGSAREQQRSRWHAAPRQHRDAPAVAYRQPWGRELGCSPRLGVRQRTGGEGPCRCCAMLSSSPCCSRSPEGKPFPKTVPKKGGVCSEGTAAPPLAAHPLQGLRAHCPILWGVLGSGEVGRGGRGHPLAAPQQRGSGAGAAAAPPSAGSRQQAASSSPSCDALTTPSPPVAGA